MKYTWTGRDNDGYHQGALQATVIAPKGKEKDARALASLIADGYTRKEAGKWLNESMGISVKGFRVLCATRVT